MARFGNIPADTFAVSQRSRPGNVYSHPHRTIRTYNCPQKNKVFTREICALLELFIAGKINFLSPACTSPTSLTPLINIIKDQAHTLTVITTNKVQSTMTTTNTNNVWGAMVDV